MDIRKFFSPTSASNKRNSNDEAKFKESKSVHPKVKSQKGSVGAQKVKTRKRKFVVLNSDSEEEPIPKDLKRKTESSDDVEILDISSDSTSQEKTVKTKVLCSNNTKKGNSKNTTKDKKVVLQVEQMKPVAVSEYFQQNTIKRSTFRTFQKKETVMEKITCAVKEDDPFDGLDVIDDDDFNETLAQLDLESAALNKLKENDLKEENKIQVDEEVEAVPSKKKLKENDLKEENEIKVDEEVETVPSKKKVVEQKTNSEKTPPKKEVEANTKGKTPEEKRRENFLAYQRFKNRDGPQALGSKEIPQGAENCLHGLSFVLTGVLESIERDEAKELIIKYGGKVMNTLSKNTTHLVAGRDSGPAKLEKAQKLGTIQITEDELLELIRTRPSSNQKNKKVEQPLKKKQKLFQEAASGEPLKSTEPNSSSNTTVTTTLPPLAVKEPSETSKNGDIQVEDCPSEKPNLKPVPEKKNESKPVWTEEPLLPSKSRIIENSSMWVDKYKPATLKQVIGQQGDRSNAKKLVDWLKHWHENRLKNNKKPQGRWLDDGSTHKAVLLSGSPGVGKTTTAQLACRELGLEFVELNASDTRSKKNLQHEVAQLLQNTTLSGLLKGSSVLSTKHVVIMDEVDGMSGNEDRGGTQELILLIKNSRIPIICICNDRQHPKIRSLSNYCYDLRFHKPRLEQIKGAMMSIAYKEGLKISGETLNELILATNQDVRQVLHNLSLLGAKQKKMSSSQVSDNKKSASTKDIKLGPFEVLRRVFSPQEASSSFNEKSRLFFHDYSLSPLFVQENYLNVNPSAAKDQPLKHLKLISQTADSIRDGDLVDKIIRTRNNWSLLPTQAIYSSVLPGDLLRGHLNQMINFPAWLGKNSNRNRMERTLQLLQMHMRLRISGNKTELNLAYIPLLRDLVTRPLVEREVEGVKDVIAVMTSYFLIKEDLESLAELNKWPGSKDPMANVSAKVKAALTRTFNKEGTMNPYSTISVKKGRSKEAGYSMEGQDGDENIDEEEEEEEVDDNIDLDCMIKKKKPATKGSKNQVEIVSNKGKGQGKTSRGRNTKKR